MGEHAQDFKKNSDDLISRCLGPETSSNCLLGMGHIYQFLILVAQDTTMKDSQAATDGQSVMFLGRFGVKQTR